MATTDTLKSSIRERYARAAEGAAAGCCGSGGVPCCDPITADLYSPDEKGQLPDAAVAASLGCGNPTALIELKEGDVVLDLGSGGGIDVLLSARRVGATGKVFGLDMTDEMLELARRNQQAAGVANVEFLKGDIEHIPLPSASVDVIISNCVINLSSDKDQVLREAFRVLKPGGRFAVSDVVVRGDVPDVIRRSVEAWIGCLAGALQETEYRSKLESAGFEQIEIDPWRIYEASQARAAVADSGLDLDRAAPEIDGKFASAFIRAQKPLRAGCCGPECCT
jgi:SAM-dependent methyltransferase